MNKLQTLEIIRDRIIEVVTVADLLDREGIKTRGSRCGCPICGSDTKTIFGFKRSTFNCFGCGEKGNLIDLVMKINNITFEEALLKLNYDFGLGLDFDTVPTVEQIKQWNKARTDKIKWETCKGILKRLRCNVKCDVATQMKLRKIDKLNTVFEDDVIDNPEIIKYLGIKKYTERGDFK